MTEKTVTISDMIRSTSINTSNFLNQIADHIEQLEARIVELESQLEEKCNDENT